MSDIICDAEETDKIANKNIYKNYSSPMDVHFGSFIYSGK
jgi:hypothetical protein